MKRILAIILCLALLVTSALAFGSGTGAAVYTNTTTYADGLTYRNDISRNSAGSLVETFTLSDSALNGVYPIVVACDTIYGGMTITNAVKYAESLGYNVVAAVNADFGYWDTRISCGMVVENGVYKSSPEGNNAIAFSDGKTVVSYMPEVNITIKNDTTGESLSTTHLNKSRTGAGLYLYSEYFSTVSTRTSGDGWFVRMKVTQGELALSGSVTLTVEELIDDKEAVRIGEGYIVLTASDAAALGAAYESFSIGDSITIMTSCSDDTLVGMDWVSGCGNIIVRDSEIYRSEYWDSSITPANPRTAIGVKADGTLVYYVMDGRTSASAGSTLRQLADDLISMGCVTAVNMDGGGSTALALRVPGESGLKVVNVPSDGSLRSVCSYIMLVTDTASTGAAKRLFLGEDGAVVLAGSSMSISAAATDAGLHSVSTGNFTATASRGSVSGTVYTAPGSAGTDTVTLSSGVASGTGTIHVVSRPDSISVYNKATGTSVSLLSLSQGESVSLAASAKYLSRSVNTAGVNYQYSVSGDIGAVTEDGVFTASGAPGAEGTITVSLAGVTKKIAVSVDFEFPDVIAHWSREYVKTLYDKGVVTGVTDTSFAPDSAMRRCDFLVMLWRAAGKPEYAGESAFADVADDAYYAQAVNWAASAGIAQGSNGYFSPLDTLTREQGFTFLYRALSALGVQYADGEASSLSAFTDAAEVSDWAATAAATLVKMGVVQGSGGALTPGAGLTRSQMAKLLCAAVYGGLK